MSNPSLFQLPDGEWTRKGLEVLACENSAASEWMLDRFYEWHKEFFPKFPSPFTVVTRIQAKNALGYAEDTIKRWAERGYMVNEETLGDQGQVLIFLPRLFLAWRRQEFLTKTEKALAAEAKAIALVLKRFADHVADLQARVDGLEDRIARLHQGRLPFEPF